MVITYDFNIIKSNLLDYLNISNLTTNVAYIV